MSLDQYPTDEELDAIKNWKMTDTNNYCDLMEFVKGLWWMADWGWHEYSHPEGGILYTISTGGWSGNEDIIAALQDNTMFWLMSWQSARRGGHYEFQLKTIETTV
jgi:hypothetical protein